MEQQQKKKTFGINYILHTCLINSECKRLKSKGLWWLCKEWARFSTIFFWFEPVGFLYSLSLLFREHTRFKRVNIFYTFNLKSTVSELVYPLQKKMPFSSNEMKKNDIQLFPGMLPQTYISHNFLDIISFQSKSCLKS